jgi:hypothetical protein
MIAPIIAIGDKSGSEPVRAVHDQHGKGALPAARGRGVLLSPEIDPPLVGPGDTALAHIVATIRSWNEVDLVAVDAINIEAIPA